ncbi:MAG: hypothetical protein M1335_01345 [Chloroflexi bacterium]|nr:hypothetical protein [Chloroflexota bacterium]
MGPSELDDLKRVNELMETEEEVEIPGGVRLGGHVKPLPAEPDGIKDIPGQEDGPEKTIPFFPDHFISEATAVFLMLCVLTVLCIFFPAFLDIKANPSVTPLGSKPEWYFLFLYAFLHFVPPLVSVLAPIVGVILLVFLPFLDRSPERAPNKRIVAISGSMIILTMILILSYVGYRD